MFDELLRQPGVREVLELRSAFGFMAFHGGSLEEMTDRVAVEAAERADASLYAVVQPPDFRWHVPSTQVSPDASPALARFLGHVEVVVAVHGFGRDGLWTSLLLGGRNRELATHVARVLRAALPEYQVVDEVATIPAALRGLHADNPVNLARGGGIQLELPPRVRGMGPHWREWHAGNGGGDRLTPHTEALIVGLAAAAEEWVAR